MISILIIISGCRFSFVLAYVFILFVFSRLWFRFS